MDEGVTLLSARADMGWFRRLLNYAICFSDGRLRFSEAIHFAPFPSMVVHLGTDTERSISAFGDIGDIWMRVVDR